MKRKIFILSMIATLIFSFSARAETVYTPNPNGGYDSYDPNTGCSGWVPNAPITVGNDPYGGNSGESHGNTSTVKKEEETTKSDSATISGSNTGQNSGSKEETVNKPGSSTTTTEKTPGSSSSKDVEVPGGNTSSSGNGNKDGTNTGTGAGNKDGANNGGPAGAGNKDGTNTGTGTGNKEGNNDGNKTGNKDGTNTGTGTGNKDGTNTGAGNKDGTNTGTGNGSNGGDRGSDIYDSNGNIIKENFPGAIQKVEIGKDGKFIMHVTSSNGNGEIILLTYDEFYELDWTSSIIDKEGNRHDLNQKLTQKDGYITEEEFLYVEWSMINVTNTQSKYYGYPAKVARTKEKSTQIYPDLDGTYQIIGTPWFRKDYYQEYTVREEDCDAEGNCHSSSYTVREFVGSEIISKASDEYTAKVPLICTGCPIPVICVNGACDCATKLNSICDESHKSKLNIKERVELEK